MNSEIIKITHEPDGTRIESRASGEAKVDLPDGTSVYWSDTSIMISCSDTRQIILFKNGERWITRPDNTKLVMYHDEESQARAAAQAKVGEEIDVTPPASDETA